MAQAPPSYDDAMNAPPSTIDIDNDDIIKKADTIGITVGAADQEQKNNGLDPPGQVERQRSLINTITLARRNSLGNVNANSVANLLLGDDFGRQQTELEETYYCQICLSNVGVSEGFTLSECGHQFCRVCLNGYWTSKIRDGSVFLRCFHTEDENPPCGVAVPREDIFEMVEHELFEKYEKFLANAQHRNARQCPYCDNTQLGSESDPIMTCESCGKQYCYLHSNAHPMDETCHAYDKRTLNENKMSEDAISEHAKPCPRCGMMISKSTGCNHMRCVRCQCSFCWLCLVEIEDVSIPPHFSDITSKCYKQQFTDENAVNPVPRPVQIMLLCLFGLPAALMTIVMLFACCPCVICCGFIMGDGDFNLLFTLRQIWTGWLVFFVGALSCLVVVAFAPPIIFILAVYQLFAIFIPCFPDLDFSTCLPDDGDGGDGGNDGRDDFIEFM